jgi:hypothetical protein
MQQITQPSRKKKIINHVTFSIVSHLTEGTKSQSSGCEGLQIIGSLQHGDDRKRRGNYMKFSKISNGLLLGMTLVLATGASAATKGSLKLEAPVSVNGMQLAKGEYKVTWEGTGPNVELTIIQSNKIVATVQARLVDLNRPGKDNGYETQMEEDASTSLTFIRFSGKKYELAIGQGSAATDENTIGSQK